MKNKQFDKKIPLFLLLILLPSGLTLSCATLSLQEEIISPEKIGVDCLYRSELITIIYPLYGSYLDDFTIFTISNDNSGAITLIIKSEITGYTTPAIDTVIVEGGDTIEVRQNPRLIPNILENLNTAKPASFHYTIDLLSKDGEKRLIEETEETIVFAQRDFPWEIEGFNSQEVFELIAAMITPNDLAVEQLLRAAAEYTSDGIIVSGYGDGELDENGSVYERLAAIWEAEANDYQLTYINTSVTYAPGDIQRIRLPDEVLEQQSGNCIELAILFASAAEAIDLEAALIRIPGHAYVAVRMDQVNAQYYVIETTLIGRAGFDEALSRGSEELAEALPHIDAGDLYWDWITIALAREKGILPLPTQ